MTSRERFLLLLTGYLNFLLDNDSCNKAGYMSQARQVEVNGDPEQMAWEFARWVCIGDKRPAWF